MLRVAFYRGTHAGLPGVYNRLVRWWTRSVFSHVELLLVETTTPGRSYAASASYMDGGVRFKTIDFDPKLWEFVELPEQLREKAWDWFARHEGAAYDLLGNVHFVFSPAGDDKRKWFCSEAVAAALGIPSPERFDPGTLHAALSILTQPATAGFLLSETPTT